MPSRSSQAFARTFTLVLTAFIAVNAGTMGCGGKKPPPAIEPTATDVLVDAGPESSEADGGPPQKPLFERLGGKEGISALVESWLQNAVADKALKRAFGKAVAGPAYDHMKSQMIDQLCESSGGPCKYSGKDMKSAHKGLGLNDAQWENFLSDLKLALDERAVGDDEKAEIFARLASMHDDIVEKKRGK